MLARNSNIEDDLMVHCLWCSVSWGQNSSHSLSRGRDPDSDREGLLAHIWATSQIYHHRNMQRVILSDRTSKQIIQTMVSCHIGELLACSRSWQVLPGNETQSSDSVLMVLVILNQFCRLSASPPWCLTVSRLLIVCLLSPHDKITLITLFTAGFWIQ